MGKYRAGRNTPLIRLRLNLWGALMVFSQAVTDRAVARYRKTYRERYGEPTVGEILGLEPTRR